MTSATMLNTITRAAVTRSQACTVGMSSCRMLLMSSVPIPCHWNTASVMMAPAHDRAEIEGDDRGDRDEGVSQGVVDDHLPPGNTLRGAPCARSRP